MSDIKDFQIRRGTLTKYIGTDKKVIIPNEASKIANLAFCGCNNLVTVVIPSNVTNIGRGVFFRCENLTYVEIQSDNCSIDSNAFGTHDNLTIYFKGVSLSNVDKSFKKQAFLGFVNCADLESVDEEIKGTYIKYAKSQKKKLYVEIPNYPKLLTFMCENKIIPLDDYDKVFEIASENNELIAQLIEYKNVNFSIHDQEKAFERELLKNPLSVDEMKKVWSYSKTKDKQIIIKGYKGNDVDVVVPNMIGKNKVIAISSAAFSPLQKRVSNEIAESRRKIESIVIPDGVEYLDCLVFHGCESLKKIEIPSTVRCLTSHIDDKYEYYDFAYKTSYLGDCSNLTEIVISEDNKELVYKDQMLINKNTVLYVHPKKAGECVLDENITDIYGAAFRGSEITFIAIPSSEMIGHYAFDNCQQLKKVELPNNVFTIGSNAFSNCVQLEEVINLDKARIIGEKAFYNCERLKCIDVQNAENIEDSAFKDCVELEKINISNVKYLGMGAFSNCGISSVIITKHNQKIEEKLFSNCCNLARVVYEAGEHKMSYHMFAFCENLKEFHCLEKTIIDEFSTPFYASKNVTIYAPAGSNAEQYAKKHKIPFIAE